MDNNYFKNLAECKKFFECWDLPDDINISTMTITCKIDMKFNVENIGKYIELNKDIVRIKFGNDTNKTLVQKKTYNRKKKSTPKKRGGKFFNQVTLVICSQNNKELNIKLFTNGSLQMTGCKSMIHVVDSLTILFTELQTIKAIYDPTSKKIVDKPFVTDLELLDIKYLYSFKICMINSDLNIEFMVNRNRLYDILLKDGYPCHYDPNNHACVNIKYYYSDIKKISIFVFESGKIVITGANNHDHIISAYRFIVRYLILNHNKIFKKEISIEDISTACEL